MIGIVTSTVIGFVFGALVVYALWRAEEREWREFLCGLHEYLSPKKNGTAQKAARLIKEFLEENGG